VRCTFGIPAAKVEKVFGMAKQLMGCVRRKRRQLRRGLRFPESSSPGREILFAGSARLSLCVKCRVFSPSIAFNAAIREVRHWTGIKKDWPHRPILPRPVAVSWTLHTDSSMEVRGATPKEGIGPRGSRVSTRSMATETRRCRAKRTSRSWSHGRREKR
jgi:hypothetical protein